ncbi:MAG: 30S ribosomal protein S1 [SAR324 cluster bacterium]|nr:30S ribosomal protein S1 [SAR324 cluster bacterium]
MTDQEKVAPIPAVVAPSIPEPIVFLADDDEDFDALYEESVQGFRDQDIVSGTVTEITRDYVTVDIGFKSDCLITVNEFQNSEGVLEVEVGDTVEVYVEALEADEDGITYLSKRKAEKVRTWEKIGDIYEEDGIVRGTVVARIKGGLSVDIGVKAFLPGSQVDLRPVRNLDKLLGEEFDFKVLKFNQKRGNIVLSRRVLLEIDRDEKRLKTLDILQEGSLINGYVKNITDYGVFVDLGGVDGLLHITDMTWGRIVHPSEMFEIGDEVEVVVLKYFPDDQKVSLGLKQKAQNPWEMVEEKFAVGTKISGKIVSLTDYGAFIEIEPGVEGLIHVSEMSWTKRVRHPSKVVELGQMVEAIVKDLDVERKRISLSIKEVQANPWKLALDRYPVGCIVKGSVRNVTDFGIFIGLDEGIDGLVHVSDISWKQRQCKPSEVASKGDEIEVKVLNIDVDQERLSLGIKQLTDDPWKDLDEKSPLGTDITGTVVNLTDFGIFVEVSEGVEGLVHISEIDSTIPKKKVHDMYPVGSVVKANVIKIDLEERRLGLSISEIISTPEPAPSVPETEQEAVVEEGSKDTADTEAPVESAEVAEEASEEVAEKKSAKDKTAKVEVDAVAHEVAKDVTDDAEATVESAEVVEETSEKVAEKKTAKNKTAKVEVDAVAPEVAKDESDDTEAPVESAEVVEESSEKVAEKKPAKNKTAKVEVDAVAPEVAKDESDDAEAPVESAEVAEEANEEVDEKKTAKKKTAKVEVDAIATEVAKDESDDTEAEAHSSEVAKDDASSKK